MNDLTFATAHQLAQMIRDRQVSAVEVIDAHLVKISRHNAQLNAICTLDAENARTRAKEADLALDRGENWGVLHGVPVTIKDIFETAGAIPEVPGMPVCLRQMMTVGCFARSIADLQLCFELIAGADPRRPDVPPMPLDTPSGKSLTALKIAWSDEWVEVPVAGEIKSAMVASAQKLAVAGANVNRWMPSNFDFSDIFVLYGRMAAYVNKYAQPIDRYNVRRSVELLWRTATQGDRELRQLGDFSRFLTELLNPSLKGYFQALTERD